MARVELPGVGWLRRVILIKTYATPWDSKALGKETLGILVSPDSTIAQLDLALRETITPYLTVRLQGLPQLFSPLLASHNIFFVESMFSLRHPLSSGSGRTRVSSPVTIIESTADLIEDLEQRILSGMFQTDRYSLDENVGLGLSSRRYLDWLKQETESGAEIKFLSTKSRVFGFFIIRVLENSRPFIALSGTYSDANIPGAGVFLQQVIVSYCESNNLAPLETSVSLNNLPALRAHIEAGFNVHSTEHIFVRNYI